MGDFDRDSRDDSIVVPVLSEELRRGVRRVPTGGVRVKKRVGEDEEIIDQPLRSEQVEVRRVLRDEVVSGPLPVRHEGDTVIVPVVKEILKTEKQFVLTEEIHVIKRVVEQRHVQRVALKHEQAEVERIDAAGNPVGPAETSSVPPKEAATEPAPVTREEKVVSPGEISLRRPGILSGERPKSPARKNHFLPNE
ncbi:MAG: YsnF/AvaK domain-containing protein [Bryobacteraceae bacterium]